MSRLKPLFFILRSPLAKLFESRGGLFFGKGKAVLLFFLLGVFSLCFIYAMYFLFLIRELPSIDSLKNYSPPLVTAILDRNGRKAGEFFKERRILVPYSEFPPVLVQAFVSAEDGRFFEHRGLNLKAIFRAFLANLKAGRKVQGGSTITQQVARSLLLSSEKTYKRKIKEAVLALRMEKNLSKEEILYLYLNQIYLGHGAYGVGMAAKVYFRKNTRDLTLAECSMLAGLPQAPSRFSPIYNPKKARERQIYVLQRMVEENYIDRERADQVGKTALKVFLRGKYHEKAPYYLETLRQSLLKKLDEQLLLTGGLTIKTALDLPLQALARKHLRAGLRALDKRQGFRGPLAQLKEEKVIQEFLKKEAEQMMEERRQFRVIEPKGNSPTGRTSAENHLRGIKEGEIVKALVQKVDDAGKKVLLQLPFGEEGVIPLENMKWARKPDSKVSFKFFSLKKPSLALKKGDVVFVKVERPLAKSEQKEFFGRDFETQKKSLSVREKQKEAPLSLSKRFLLSLEQEPLVEGALIAFDQKTEDIVALVGGYDFHRSQFNRAYQAARQTGSVFKPLVYLAALDKGFTPVTLITDAPVVYAEEEAEGLLSEEARTKIKEEVEGGEKPVKTWKPNNYGRRFSGEILFRNALIRSMNVPTVKVIEKVGIEWVSDYARRLGIFSSLNPDYTLALGSSSVTLYEMTKVFSVLGRQGRRIRPLILHEVLGPDQTPLLSSLSLDERFFEQMRAWDETMEQRREEFLKQQSKENPSPEEAKKPEQSNKTTPSLFFSDPDQLISKKTAFIMTTLLNGVIKEPQGTGWAARGMDGPVAGKTGTTNGYYDTWFIGYSPQLVVGVWMGFDDEKTLGRGETGAKSALPVWLEFMKFAQKGKIKEEFEVPEGIVFTHIDNETGGLVSTESTQIVRQAFIEGTGPKENAEVSEEGDQDFLREDFSR